MQRLNLGILAHVDAGKTSLRERLLHAAGVIDELGSVDDGSTQTDSLTLEHRRGITIRSAGSWRSSSATSTWCGDCGTCASGTRSGAPPGAAPRRPSPRPTLETVVVPEREADRGALHAALTRLAAQDR